MMSKLSAFLIVRNEARDIAACLESLRGLADEVVVVDDHSTDETRAICERLGARVTERRLDGFGSQKQFALDQTTGDWLLSIDADERLTPELAAAIRSALIEPTAEAFEVRRAFFFLGRPLRHGGLGRDWVLRLFKKGAGRFTRAPVHERIEVQGRVGRLDGALLHYSYDSIDEYVDKSNRYTELAARELLRQGRRFRWTDNVRPFWELFVRIAFKGAWLDGAPGLIYAALSAHTAWLRAVKLWSLSTARRRGVEDRP